MINCICVYFNVRNPDCLVCEIKELKSRIDKLESENNTHCEAIVVLERKVDELEIDKTQSDFSRRLAEQHDTCIHIHCKTITHLSFKINQLKSSLREFELERVNPKFEELEEKINNRDILCPSMDLIITIRQSIETWQTGCEVIINEMQKKIDELERWDHLRDKYFNDIQEKVNELLERDQMVKTPHKCPICFGIGKLLEYNDKICISCEGKGIVWG